MLLQLDDERHPTRQLQKLFLVLRPPLNHNIHRESTASHANTSLLGEFRILVSVLVVLKTVLDFAQPHFELVGGNGTVEFGNDFG